ncbi:hypothetical protein GWI33_014443, partial [Rhynchophorus ferrugineus]
IVTRPRRRQDLTPFELALFILPFVGSVTRPPRHQQPAAHLELAVFIYCEKRSSLVWKAPKSATLSSISSTQLTSLHPRQNVSLRVLPNVRWFFRNIVIRRYRNINLQVAGRYRSMQFLSDAGQKENKRSGGRDWDDPGRKHQTDTPTREKIDGLLLDGTQ